MAHFLVTGGCGFIGSHLSASLIAAGHRVRVLDDLSTGQQDNLAPGATLMIGDVADPQVVRRAMRDMNGCFHLAAIASVERCQQAWIGSHKVNLTGMIAVLDAARQESQLDKRRRPVAVVYASSAAVYGMPDHIPLTEDSPVRPISAYGADKLGCELHAKVAAEVHGVPTAGLRFFNVFGPRQDPRSPYSGVISIFCERLVRGAPIVIHGDGGQTRDFIYVADVVAALSAAMRTASRAAPVFNVCTGRPTTVMQLAACISRVCGHHPFIEYRSPRVGDIRHSVGSGDRARDALRLGPTVGLEDGLRQVMAWLRAGSPSLAPQPSHIPRMPAMASHSSSERATMIIAEVRHDQRATT